MISHYDILGVSAQAGSTEIKTAFRRLAKIYHPDKNPREKEAFAKILKAYETLSDPVLKARYDQHLRYNTAQGKATEKGSTKNWRFDEREIKRRRYYEEHFKQHEKAKPVYDTPLNERGTYNEYKYILIATPLAVALFLLLIQLASPEHSKTTQPLTELVSAANPVTHSERVVSEEGPYALFFGSSKFDTRRTNHFEISNHLGLDAIVCVFGEHGFIRSCLLTDGSSTRMEQLPDEKLQLRLNTGKLFNPERLQDEEKVLGAFDKNRKFYKSWKLYPATNKNELTLQKNLEELFEPISEKEFFNLEQK